MELEETAVEKAFKELKLEIECRGMKLLDSIFFRRKSNFSGGCGDYRTLHEEMFASLYPMLKPDCRPFVMLILSIVM